MTPTPQVYRAFRRKDEHFFLVQTSEIYQAGEIRQPSLETATDMPSLLEFLERYNPVTPNENQVCCASFTQQSESDVLLFEGSRQMGGKI